MTSIRIIASILLFLVAGCASRGSTTHRMWYHQHEVLEISDLDWEAKNRIIAANPGAELRMSPDGQHLYLKPADSLDRTNLVVKTLATPITVMIDGVVLTVVGIVHAADAASDDR